MATLLPDEAAKRSLAAVRSAILKSQAPVTQRAPSEANSDDEEATPVPMPGEEDRVTLAPGLISEPSTVAPTQEPSEEDVITVFADPTKFNVKHPLHSTWQLWFDSASKQDKAKSWDDALVKVIAFDSVEQFWG